MGDGGVSIPPWSVLGGAFGEAIESLVKSKGVREEALLGKPLEVYFGRRQRDRTRICICLLLFYPCLLCSDVGSLWSQGLEGISVKYRMWTRMYSSTCICWVPMGGPLSSQGLEATSVSIWVPMWDHCGRKD